MLDNFYLSIFNYYKKRIGKRSKTLALYYINVLELSICLALGAFFVAFASQMRVATMSLSKFSLIFGLLSVFIIFKNWMRYNGKRRLTLNAKHTSKKISVLLLWILPIGCLLLGFVLLQVV